MKPAVHFKNVCANRRLEYFRKKGSIFFCQITILPFSLSRYSIPALQLSRPSTGRDVTNSATRALLQVAVDRNDPSAPGCVALGTIHRRGCVGRSKSALRRALSSSGISENCRVAYVNRAAYVRVTYRDEAAHTHAITLPDERIPRDRRFRARDAD